MMSDRHKPIGKVTAVSEDELLDAAREAILAVGWSRTTLTDVARRAGVSRMTLYRKWPDMNALLADLMTREWTDSIGASVVETTDNPLDRGNPLQLLVGTLVATIQAVRKNELLGRIVDVDPELLLPYLLNRRGRSQEFVLGILGTQIRAGQKAGAIREGEPELLARSVVLAAHGFALSAHTMLDGVQDRGADVTALDQELSELIERYLRP
jgi:AcrR family transcriptional regulator